MGHVLYNMNNSVVIMIDSCQTSPFKTVQFTKKWFCPKYKNVVCRK